MRNLKKALVLVLSLAMMLSIMVVGAGAAFPDQKDIDTKHADAVNMCVALKIIEGNTDGTFAPKENVTREQMAKMICVLDNGGEAPKGAIGNTFTDVAPDRWSNQFIETCAARGIVVGIGNNMFNPAGNVTASQAAKMLLIELGYNDVQQKYVGPTWATYVNIDASAKGYYKDLEDVDTNAPLSREHAAQMIWNALQAKEVEYTYTLVTNPDGSVSSMVKVGDKVVGYDFDRNAIKISLLKDKYNADEPVFIMDKIDYNSDKEEFSYYGYDPDDGPDDRMGDYTTSEDFSDLYGQKVKAVVDAEDGDVYGIVPEDSSVIVTGVWGDAETKDDGKKIEINDVEYKVDTEFENVFMFCKDQWGNIDEDDFDMEAIREIFPWFTFEAIDNNDNGKIDTLVFYPVSIEQVNFVNKTDVRTDAAKYTFEDDEIDTSIEKDDFVVVTHDDAVPTEVNQLVKADVVSGTVGATKNDTVVGSYKVRIDGVWYKAAVDEYPALDQDVELVVYNGYYFDVDKISADLDMAVITDTGDFDYKTKEIQMTLMFTDGSQETVPVDELTLFEGLLDMSGVDTQRTGTETYTAREINSMLNNVAGFYDYLLGTTVFYSVDKGTYTLRELTDSMFDFATIVDLDGNETDYTGGNFYTMSNVAVNYDKDEGTVVIMGDEEYDISNNAMIVIDKRDSDTGENDGFTFMTGADFMKKNSQKFNYATVVLDDDDNVAAMVVSTYKNMTTGDELYGLITDAYVELNDDGDKALFIDMITEDGKLERVETDGSTSGYGSWVGEVINYSYDDDNVLLLPDDGEDVSIGSVKDYNDTRVTFYSDPTDEDEGTYRIKLADDATIVSVGLDEDDFADSTWEGNALAKAASYWDGDEYYYNNALFVLDDDNKICAIFCDVNGDTGFVDSLK